MFRQGRIHAVNTPQKREFCVQGRNSTGLHYPSTYKETELSKELNDGTEWVIIDYGRSLKQGKDPLPPRANVI